MLALMLLACQPATVEDDVGAANTPQVVAGSGAIAGRICQQDGDGWQEAAQVSTNIMSNGVPVDTATTWTDRAGRFMLEGLPGDASYDLVVQVGGERLTDQEASGVYVSDDELVELDDPTCGVDPADVELAVVVGSYDSVELVLDDLGYTNTVHVDGLVEDEIVGFFLDGDALAALDMVLIDGGHLEEGVIYATGSDQDATVDAVLDGVRTYVEDGGTLLASDWAYDLVERTWPDKIAFFGDDGTPDSAQLGQPAVIMGSVVDGELADALGLDYLEIEFDLPEWPAITEHSDAVTTLVAGDVEIESADGVAEDLYDAPLLVRLDVGQGHVYFSSFPFAANRNTEVADLLDQLIRLR